MNKTNRIMYRQGDVIIERVETPEGKFKRATKTVILAHGEATGHMHMAVVETKPMYRMDNPDGSFFLRFSEQANVTHQEHATITLEPGTYRVSRQVEYTPQAIVRVAD